MSVEREAFEKALPKPPCVWWEDAIGCYCGGNEAAEEVAEMYQSHWKTWQAARAQGEAEPGEVPHELGQAVSSWLAGHPDTDWSDSENVDAMIREAVLPNLSRVPRGSCVSQHAESDTQAPGRVPEGYALVPIEPTTRQVYAAEFPIDDVVSIRQSSQHAIAKAAYKAMLTAAPTAQPTGGEWVRCEDRLPSKIGHYCIALADPDDIGWSTSVTWTAFWNGDDFEDCDPVEDGQPVTHWMPLPQPPQDRKGK